VQEGEKVMSIWEDFFEADYKNIPYLIVNKNDYVSEQIEHFVGTKKQIEEEEARLIREVIRRNREYREAYHQQVNNLIDAWKHKLYHEYLGVGYPVELHNKLYAEADERGHSSGYSEIENYYIIMSDLFVEIYELGRKSMKEE
jgi:hypothetical protein